MRLRWTLFGFPGKPYVLLRAKLINESTRSITIDEDEGNRHEGLMLLRGCNLENAAVQQPALRFKVGSEDSLRFFNAPWYAVMNDAPRATIYGERKGITYGYLDGDTAPNMWVTRQAALDFVVNGTKLDGGESVGYYLFVGLHDGGQSAPEEGKAMFKEAQGLI